MNTNYLRRNYTVEKNDDEEEERKPKKINLPQCLAKNFFYGTLHRNVNYNTRSAYFPHDYLRTELHEVNYCLTPCKSKMNKQMCNNYTPVTHLCLVHVHFRLRCALC